ncbi:MAG TPA: thioredoxin family protein, partial [Pyrinomonadaceae bacterium]|nr:thioredoxin family protein [Pyrinomonadaceae bacterium]
LMKKNAIALLLAAMFITAAVAGSARSTENDLPTPPAIGATVEDFTLPDADGKDRSLNSLKGKNGSVLIFVATKCPVSNAYNERMEKLAQDYKARGISVIGINSNVAETADAVKTHAAANNLTFPILKDTGNKVADRLGATVTPEAYFLDANNKLLYRGRIDNAKDASQVNSSELRDAIEAALAGKPIAKTTATAFGCTIKRA